MITGTLCVPSDDERKTDKSIEHWNVTYADLTPSTASVVPIETLSRLQTLVLGGKDLLDEARRWATSIPTVLNPYGPSECTYTSTIAVVDPAEPYTSVIGKGAGVVTWIVNSVTGALDVPIGIVGELLLEGSLVGAGYSNDLEKTEASFIKDPSWLLQGAGATHPGRCGRLYETSDLVKYDSMTGDIIFAGRKDTQIKINGQRVELSDIEHHIYEAVPAVLRVTVIVEHVQPTGASRGMLVAMFNLNSQFKSPPSDSELRKCLGTITSGLESKLGAKLPSHSMPAAYLPFATFPATVTMKTDRRRLREQVALLTLEQIRYLDSGRTASRDVETEEERLMREAWATVLGLEPSVIGACDSFLRLGGDSIAAMKVTRELRFRGISLRLAAVLKSPRLSVMALAMQFGEQATAQDAYRPLSLVPSDVTLARVDELLQPWEIQPSAVDDIMPTTDEQARHVALIYSAARTLLLYHTLDGSGPLAIDKLEIAIARLVARFSILRTVFMPHRNSFLQVVLKRSDTHTAVVEASNGDTLDMVCDRSVENDVVEDLLFGTCLTRFIIIHCKDQYRIVCRISHAQHDGMSIANMWTAFEALCSTDRVPRAPDNKHSFAQHMRTLAKLDTPAALSHWQRLLNKSSPTRLKAQSTCQLNFDEGPSITSTIFEQSMRSIDYTFATVLKAAWAAVLAKFCAKQDVVFGTLINGRSEADAQEILGPCSPDDDRQRLSRMPFENLGSRTIIRECTQWPRWSYFGSVVRHNNLDSEQSDRHQRNMHDGDSPQDSSIPDIDSAEVHVVSALRGKDISLSVGFAAHVVSDFVAHAIAEDLRSTIVRFYRDIDALCVVENEPLPTMPTTPTTPTTPAVNSHHGSPRYAATKEREIVDALDLGSSKLVAALESAWQAIFGFDVDRERMVSESFFNLGGDLIGANALSAHMQVAGYSLPVEDVIRHPTFRSQVGLLSKVE